MARRKKRSRRRRSVSIVGDVLAAGVILDGILMGGQKGTKIPIAGEVRDSIEQLLEQYHIFPNSEAAQNLLSGALGAIALKKLSVMMHKSGINPRFMGLGV